MIRAIIFDCFGVLYVDPSKAFYEANVPNYHEIFQQLHDIDRQIDYGLISKTEHHEQVSELTGLSVDFIAKNIHGTHIRNEELMASLASLRETYKIGMLSNISPGDMDTFFTPDERRSFFDADVLSGEVGITKPHPYIFQIMAERLGVEPGECIMVDDLEDNCAGADAAGMKAVLYRTNTQTLADLKKIIDSNA